MTVQELIDELLKIKDKSKDVVIRTDEHWGCKTVSYITEDTPDTKNTVVAIWRE